MTAHHTPDFARCESNACIEVTQIGANVRIHSTVSGTTCQATVAEWLAFLYDLADGKHAHIGAEESVSL